MIPLSAREEIEYTDEDGVVWQFVPKTDAMERETYRLLSGAQTMQTDNVDDILALQERSRDFFNRLVRGWKAPPGVNMPEYNSEDPASAFNSEERSQIVAMWHSANRLTVEQKKS